MEVRETGEGAAAAGVAASAGDAVSPVPTARLLVRLYSCQHLSRAKTPRSAKSIVFDVASAGVIFVGADSLTHATYSFSSCAVSAEISVRIVSRF